MVEIKKQNVGGPEYHWLPAAVHIESFFTLIKDD